MDNPNYNLTFWVHNTDMCKAEINREENWQQLPLLNSYPTHCLKEGQLVRFRGMIQDMYNPVLYFSSYEVRNITTNETTMRSGKYKDSLECSEEEEVLFESEANVNKERRSIYCVSIPGLNNWAQLPQNSNNEVLHNNVHSSVKRSIDMDTNSSDGQETEMDKSSKRPDSSKRFCDGQQNVDSNEGQTNSIESDLNLPIPNLQGKACIVNLYDEEEGNLKLNDVIEVAGFLSFDPSLMGNSFDDDSQDLPHPSLVPRLHAVMVKDVKECNPLVTTSLDTDEVWKNASTLRSELKLVLTQLLLGDTLAADYLILHLISTVYKRQDMMALGKFSLNLSNCPANMYLLNYTDKLYAILSELLHKSHFFPMSLTNMNSTNLIPKKNYETNRLVSGQLQLSDKTHLVVDETKLQPGTLDDRGVKNVQALTDVISFQKLDYDFQFYPVEVNTNIPVLIFSEGKSMLPSDCHVVLQPDEMCISSIEETFEAVKHFIKEPLLSQLRLYFSIVPTREHDISTDMQQIVHEDFVKLRQDNNKFTGDDLHTLLVLARLQSLSHGQHLLTNEIWKAVQIMERERKARIVSR